jgi:CRP-like cAMP-binding protein
MAILGPGSLFGYGQSLFDHPEPFRCVTNGRASILRMNEDTMNGLLEAHPPLADYLRATMSRRIDLAAAIVEAQNEFHG